MVFSYLPFVFAFLPLFFLSYYAVGHFFGTKGKNVVLFVFSLIFYAWGEPKNVLLMLLSIAVNYVFGLLLEKFDDKKNRRRLILILSVVFNLGMLFYFKYLGFFTGGRITVILPIGISFFTFQIMSYTIDVYLRNVKTQRNPFKLALYISLFPQLIAGPIVRYIDVEKELTSRTYDIDKIFKGVVRFSVGLAKKVLIADCCDTVVTSLYGLTDVTFAARWAGALFFTLQLYFDFSGYSDMAIGLGKMFGFRFLENFNYPLISRSATEFWRRWHMSLGTWFREYVYIPLGGNRKGNVRTYINLFTIFFLTGIWHGASWQFLAWGIYFGVFMVAERAFLGKWLAKHKQK